MASTLKLNSELMNYIDRNLRFNISRLQNTKGDFTQNFQVVGEIRNLLNTILGTNLVPVYDWPIYGISFDGKIFGFLVSDSQKFAKKLAVLLRILGVYCGKRVA